MNAQGHSEGLLESDCSMILVANCCFGVRRMTWRAQASQHFEAPVLSLRLAAKHRMKQQGRLLYLPTYFIRFHSYTHTYMHTDIHAFTCITYNTLQCSSLPCITWHHMPLHCAHIHTCHHIMNSPLRPWAMSRASVSRCSHKNCVVGRAGS